MKKRILCALLSAAMLLTSSPVVFAAETQPVKTERQQTKEALPFTITEANNDIKDESVKGWHVQITDTENAKDCCRLSGTGCCACKEDTVR